MGENSSIQWTHHTFNPWIGCTKVSPGCTNCYAETQRKRFGKDEWGVGKPRTRTSAANWRKPLAWDRAAAAAGERHRVFCASLADWLDPEVPIEWLAELLWMIIATPNLDWLLLTKRPELWRTRIRAVRHRLAPLVVDEGGECEQMLDEFLFCWECGTPPPSVWIGTTVEDQRRADERIPHLLSIPARVRFLSMEPLLEAVNLNSSQGGTRWIGGQRGCDQVDRAGVHHHDDRCGPGIDWVIVGGESGPRARPFDIAWARSVMAQCREAGVPVFVKQLGAMPLTDPYGGDPVMHWRYGPPATEMRNVKTGERSSLSDANALPRLQGISDSHGGDPSEWPADLRVREFPASGGGQ